MIGFLLAASLLASTFFLTVIPIFGITYSGSDDSPLYLLVILLLNIFTIVYVLYKDISSKRKVKSIILPYFIPLIILLLFSLEYGLGNILSSGNIKRLIWFFATCMPAIYLAIYCYKYNMFKTIARNFEIIAILSSIGLIISLPTMFVQNAHFASVGGGGGHQEISYCAALCVSFFMISIKTFNQEYRYSFLKKRFVYFLYWFLIVIDSLVCIIGGGRGGGVLLIFYAIYGLLCLMTWKNLLKFILFVLAISFAIISFSPSKLDDSFLEGIHRTFSYLTSSGIDLSESSGRDVIYTLAIELFNQVPFFGFGFFKQYELCSAITGEPFWHNMFIEMFFQLGPLYAFFWILLMAYVVIKMFIIGHRKDYNLYILALGFYSIIMLQISGTYVDTSVFWFIVVLVYGLSFEKGRDSQSNSIK